MLVAGLAGAGWLVVGHIGGKSDFPFGVPFRATASPAGLLAPLVAVAALVGTCVPGPLARVYARLSWPLLATVGYLTALAWSLALLACRGVPGRGSPHDLTPLLADTARAGDHPLRLFRTAAHGDHPPGALLAVWLLRRLGADQPGRLAVAFCAVGALVVPLVLAAVRSLVGAERGLAPALALLPALAWAPQTVNTVPAALGAAVVTCGVVGSERRKPIGRTAPWALLTGLLLGLLALCSYLAPTLAVAVICTYFVRRQAALNLLTCLAALPPVALAAHWGFHWTNGLTAARHAARAGHSTGHSTSHQVLAALLVLLVAGGPALVAAGRGVFRTPGWPLLIGAAAGVICVLATGVGRADPGGALLPYVPWLVIAAVPARGASPPVRATGGGAAGIVLARLLYPW